VHHAVSIALVLVSASEGYFRLGCVLMFFLDWADPFLLTAKLFRYVSTDRNDGYQLIANRLFESFVVMFVLTRIILLNYVVWIALRTFPEKARLCKMCCILLVLLQLFWFGAIVQTALHKSLNNGNADDIRSDSDDDEPEQNRIARKKQQ
jgi:hypothetical protein